MKTKLVALVLLSLALAGCVVDAGVGYGHPGYGWGGYHHGELYR